MSTKLYLYVFIRYSLTFPTALTSPIEYQRNHVGGGGPSGPPSSSSSSTGGLPGGSSTNSTSSLGGGGGGGGSGGSGGNSSSLCGPRSRPSRIPQPSSRLPQPVHHHHPPGPEGPDRSAGMWSPCHPQPPESLPSNPNSENTTNGESLASEVPKMRMLDGPHGSNCNNSNRPSGSLNSSIRPSPGGYEGQVAALPQAPVAPLNFPLKSPRVGTVSPLTSSQTLGGGKDGFVPPNPAHKGNPFWAMVAPMPSSPASRPGSFSFPSDSSGGGDSLGRGSLGTPSHHRHHSKDIDRMSTCSSTSEQSIHSTQSNGVRCQVKVQDSVSPRVTH